MPPLIDIELPENATMLMVRRPDGSLTLSVDPEAVMRALKQWTANQSAIARFISCEPALPLAN